MLGVLLIIPILLLLASCFLLLKSPLTYRFLSS